MRFLVVVLFQVLVMDNVMINGYMVPYVYLLFILLMPFETPGGPVACGVRAGACPGSFPQSWVHTAATVLAAFARPYMLELLAPGMVMSPSPSQESTTTVSTGS